jgi:hypothetical protein
MVSVSAAALLVAAAFVNFQAVTSRKNGANFFPESPRCGIAARTKGSDTMP